MSMLHNSHGPIRYPDDERLAELARLGTLGWWKDHAAKNACCSSGEPGCDIGDALSRLHSRELARRGKA